jgi:hypothetical protein
MGALFGGGDKGQAAKLAEQKKKLDAQEASQAKELASRRKAAAGGGKSKTLFSQVLGTDDAIGKQTTLGG